MLNTAITSNPGILGAHTIRSLKTEDREQAKPGFWDSFKNLSVGQKVGRSAATIGTGAGVGALAGGGALLGGLGLTLATGGIALAGLAVGALGFYAITRLMRGSQQEARVARQEECRPRETKCVKSEDTLPTRENVPLTATTILGAKDRRDATAHILNQVCDTGFDQQGPASGLYKGFLPDLNRAEFSVQTSDGQITNFGRSTFQNSGKDLAHLSDNDKSEVVNIFKGAIASEPSLENDPGKIAKWQKFASGFMNQISTLGPRAIAIQASGLQLTERRSDYMNKYNLRIEPGGQSAILECTETAGIDGVNVVIGDKMEGNNWSDENDALNYGIKRSESSINKTTVLRITMEDEAAPNDPGSAKQVRDGVGLEVLSYSSRYQIGLMSQEEFDSKIAEKDRKIAEQKEAAAQKLEENKNRYISHLMGKQPLQETEVLELQKALVPDTSRIARQIANGGLSSEQILNKVEECYFKSPEFNSMLNMEIDSEEEYESIANLLYPGKRLARQYPLSVETRLGEKLLVDGVRDYDLQEFPESKARELVATRLLGMTKESYFSAVKEGGVGLVLGKTFLHDNRLHPISAKLRSDLIADFQSATTLDDFYQRAENAIATARQNAPALIQKIDIQAVQPTVVRGAVSSLVLNSTSATPAEMKSLAADLKKSPTSEVSFQIDVLKDHSAALESWASRAIDSANDPEALRKEREFYTKDIGRATRTFQIEKEDGSFENIKFQIGVSKAAAGKLEQKLEAALQGNTAFQKAEDFLNLTQGFLHQGAFAAIFSGTAGATGLTLSDFTRTEEQPSFSVMLHRNGQIHIEGRMEMSPSAIDQDSGYVDLDAKESSLTQSFQVRLFPTIVEGQIKVDCELREAESKGSLHRLNGIN
jgi:hypothetical protein